MRFSKTLNKFKMLSNDCKCPDNVKKMPEHAFSSGFDVAKGARGWPWDPLGEGGGAWGDIVGSGRKISKS